MTNRTIRMSAKPDLEKPDLGLGALGSETTMLFEGTPTQELGAFNLHAHITYFEGALIAEWSTHWMDEDSPGQYVRYAFSKDLGKTWSDPKSDAAVLFPKMEKPLLNHEKKDENGDRLPGHRPHDRCGTGAKSENSWENDNCGHWHLMLCANGFAKVDGRLYAVADAAEGINYPGIGRVAREIGSDGSLGPIFWLNDNFPDISTITPDVLNAGVYNAVGYGGETAQKIAAYLADPRHLPQWDMMPGGWPLKEGKTHRDWRNGFIEKHGVSCCEPTYAYQAADGALVRIWRSGSEREYAQYSFDKGESWTDIEETEFPDSGARTNVGRLPDGRIYLINNAGKRRNQLCISLSEDGYDFTRTALVAFNAAPRKYAGRAKGLGFHYPHSCVAGDRLFIIYAQNKEDILVSSVPIGELDRIKKY